MSLNDNNVLGIAMGTSEAAGDVDGNGKINMVDVTKLRQYLTNKTKYPLAVEAAADVDNSGKINMVDVTKIRQYLTNKDKYPLGK